MTLALRVGLALALLSHLMTAAGAGGSSSEVRTVRLTYYLLRGVTYSGAYTGPGVAACSWDIPLGSVVSLPDGEAYTCLDRGLLGSSGWLDVWSASHGDGLWATRYGPWVDVLVIPP